MATVLSPLQPSVGLDDVSRPKSILRRPTLVRKRDEDDEDSETVPSSPGKRARVAFNNDVDIQIDEGGEKPFALIQDEVRSAFLARVRGDDTEYVDLKAIFDQDGEEYGEVTLGTMKKYVTALLGNVSSLNKANADLVKTILRSDWLVQDDQYVSLFVKLVANLTTAHGTFLTETLRMLVDNLKANPPAYDDKSDTSTVRKSTIYRRVHKTIRYLLQLIPSGMGTLKQVLFRTFPHQSGSRKAHVVYVRNLLKLIDYTPELREDILAMVTDKLVKIDVQVQVDLEDLAEEAEEGLVQDFNHMRADLKEDLEDDSESSEEESDYDADEDLETKRSREILKSVQKMDAIMEVLFVYYDRMYNASLKSSDTATVMDTLFAQFATVILPAYRSRHAQFLLFHFVQRSGTYVDQFVGICVQSIFDKRLPSLNRQSAAAYLASFVSRGVRVPASIVRDVFDYIGSELDGLRTEHESSCRGPDLRRFASYYNLVQALMYIFCFRWQDLQLEAEEDVDNELELPYNVNPVWKSGLKEAFSANLFSPLNPLKVCSPAIVEQFAKVANHLKVVYVYHVLDINKRARVPAANSARGGQAERESALRIRDDLSGPHLDAYFPFDPYHLPKSKRWIEPDYRTWQPPAGLEEDDDESDGGLDSDSDAGDEQMHSDFEEGTATDQTGTS